VAYYFNYNIIFYILVIKFLLPCHLLHPQHLSQQLHQLKVLLHMCFSNVFPNDVAQIKDFFDYYGILDMDDFLTLDDSDFKTQYSTPGAPTLYQILAPFLSND
jgi:hypothetical protein